jgi:hypothetical protein
MKNQSRSRHTIAIIILICYLLPILLLSAYSLVQKDNWSFFAMGLLVVFFGTGLLFLILCRWELELQQEVEAVTFEGVDLPEPKSMPSDTLVEASMASTQYHEVTSSIDDSIQIKLDEYQEQQGKLLTEIEDKTSAFKTLSEEKDSVQRQLQATIEEFAFYKKVVHEQVQQQDQLIKKCQDAILEQQTLVENKQQQIAALESKERDLMYEIKTLLQVVNLDIADAGR